MIDKIIASAPQIDTSWFNRGVCLDELGRHPEAAEAFIKAQELNVEDYGIHYRIIRSLFLADDLETLYEFVEYSCGLNREVMDSLTGSTEFETLFDHQEFRDLRDRFGTE